MTGTAGDGSDRRGLPRGPQALPREEVAAHQRERLFEAMVQAINERGFVATTISDLVTRAGVSRRSFYEHFESKDECLLEAFDASAARLRERIVEANGSRADYADWREQIAVAVRALFEATVNRPDAARLVCIEVGAAGAPGLERWARGTAQFERFVTAVFDAAPGEGTIADPVAKAFVGALRKILYSRVAAGQSGKALQAELERLVPELIEWLGGYYPTPAAIPRRPRARRARRLTSGRAPGTLVSRPRPASARGLPRGEHSLPRGFVEHNQRERIFDAIANLTAANGYPALGLEDIAAEAAVSLQTFYKHFDSKADAFLATYEVGHAKTVAIVGDAFAAQSTWPAGVHASIVAMLEFFAAEPAYAHIACMDILVAFPHMTERVEAASSSYAELLEVGLSKAARDGQPPPLVGEAIVGGIFELLHDYVLRGLATRLPELAEHASYIALTPFIGAEQAVAAITSVRRR